MTKFITLGQLTVAVDEILYVTADIPNIVEVGEREEGVDYTYIHFIPRPGGKSWVRARAHIDDVRASLYTRKLL